MACKLTFDKVFSWKEGSNAFVKGSESIGNAVEDDSQILNYEHNAPRLLKVLKDNYWYKSIGTNQKSKVISTLINRYEVKK